MSNTAFLKYLELEEKLVEFIVDNNDDCDEAEDFRSEMDHVWYELSTEEIDKLNSMESRTLANMKKMVLEKRNDRKRNV